ncbi:MAG: hypothetical protein IT447_14855 [Phycisphaerales bacterium]|jgi:hypothetical protein|nr:hypothetical protein [Phycisphaerales bacterium]
MNPIRPPALPNTLPAVRQRSLFVTLLAWAIMVISALLVPISVITLLMILAGSHGTSTFDPVGFVIIVIAPSATVIAGIGMLCRRNWGRFSIIGLFVILIAYNGRWLIAANPETTTYTSSTGVKTTIESSYSNKGYNLLFLVVGSLLLAGLCRRSVRDEFKSSPIPPPITNRAMAIPYVSSSGNVGLVSAKTESHPVHPSPARQRLILWMVIILFLSISGGMTWLVTSGIRSGSTILPSKQSTLRRTIHRQDEPATYWLSIGIYAAAGIASLATALWLIHQSSRPTPQRRRSIEEDYGR